MRFRAATLARDVLEGVVTWLPGESGRRLREHYWRGKLAYLGHDVRIDVGAQFVGPQHISIGDNCWIDRYAVLMAGPPRQGERKIARRDNPAYPGREGELLIGRDCHVAAHSLVNAHGGVSIGEGSTVAAGARIVSLSHHHRNLDDAADAFLYRFGSCVGDREQALISSPVVFEARTALGTNAVALPGTAVGKDAWVGAGSVVRGVIPAGCIAAGSPAAPVRMRPGYELRIAEGA